MQDLWAFVRGRRLGVKKKKQTLKSRATQLYPTYMSKSIHTLMAN